VFDFWSIIIVEFYSRKTYTPMNDSKEKTFSSTLFFILLLIKLEEKKEKAGSIAYKCSIGKVLN
jgi:hypothetical protein